MNPTMTIRIRVRGTVSADLGEWLAPLQARQLPSGDTVYSGVVPDQAAAHGLCNRLRDLGISIQTLIITRKESRP